MLQKEAGSIIDIFSVVQSSIRGIPDRYVYGAARAAVIDLNKQVAADFIKRGIRVNAIWSGTIESPSLGERVNEVSTKTGMPNSEVAQSFIDPQPMGRLGRPQEVAGLAVFLASDAANYDTGHPHLVDGGMAL